MAEMLRILLDLVAAATKITLRLTIIYFVRWLPLGPRFLPIIYRNFCAWISCFLVSILVGSRKNARRHSSLWSRTFTLTTGRYDSHAKITTALSFLLNLLSLCLALDFVYRDQVLGLGNDITISRVGYVNHDSVRLVIRHQEISRLSFQAQGSDEWLNGPISIPSVTEDFVSTLKEPSKPVSYIPKKWTLVTSSCIKPSFPYNPLGSSLRIRGLEYLSNYAIKTPIDMMLFLGDFIYIDLPIRFGSSNEHYRKAYSHLYASPSWSQTLKDMSWLHMYDDHEITNDWAANETGLWSDAMEPYFMYQHGGNPTPFRSGGSYYTFRKGDVAFFVMDTRRYRSSEGNEDGPEKTMLGPEQRADLETWLEMEKGWKIVVSSVPFTRNWRGPESIDSWAGYLWKRQRLLEKMWAVRGVIILSGDRHEHATTKFPSPDGKNSVIEFSTSPLSQFYQPFNRQYRQIEDTDVEIFSHPYGISKFGILSFDTESGDEREWTFDFCLVVDGKEIWNRSVNYV